MKLLFRTVFTGGQRPPAHRAEPRRAHAEVRHKRSSKSAKQCQPAQPRTEPRVSADSAKAKPP